MGESRLVEYTAAIGKGTNVRRLRIHRDLYIEDTDAFFSMRKEFWMESKKRALAEKEGGKSRESEEAGGSDHDSPFPAWAASGK